MSLPWPTMLFLTLLPLSPVLWFWSDVFSGFRGPFLMCTLREHLHHSIYPRQYKDPLTSVSFHSTSISMSGSVSLITPSFRPNILSITKYVTAGAIKSKLERAQIGCINANEKITKLPFL